MSEAIVGEELVSNAEKFLKQCEHISDVIMSSDVLMIAAGAGFSADSGLPTYSDIADIKAYERLGLNYDDLCDPYWIHEDLELFHGFWGDCFNRYKNSKPHNGYAILKHWKDCLFSNNPKKGMTNKSNPVINQDQFQSIYKSLEESGFITGDISRSIVTHDPFFIYTSNVDAHFHQYFLENEIYEIHGNITTWQCAGKKKKIGPCSDHLWNSVDNYQFLVDSDSMKCYVDRNCSDSKFLFCKKCRSPARPNILMFRDKSWIRNKTREAAYIAWNHAIEQILKIHPDKKIVILEIGCGKRVPSVRLECEMVASDILKGFPVSKAVGSLSITLIRINPEFPECDSEFAKQFPEAFISIQAEGLKTLEKVQEFLEKKHNVPGF